MAAQSVESQHTKQTRTTQSKANTLKRPKAIAESAYDTPNASSEYLTVPDLMAELRVSRNTVYRLLARGEMAFVKTGARSIRVHREAFEKWRREQEISNPRKGAAEETNTVAANAGIEKGPAIHTNDQPDLDPKGSAVGSIPE